MSRAPIVPSLVITALLLTLSACQDERPLAPEDGSVRAGVTTASTVSFVERASEPFGTFDGVAFVRHTGMFEGETSLGEFRVPYEIVAPEDPTLGNGTVLVEPPHFAFGLIGRDQVLGRGLLFDRGFRYAAVGFGLHGLNILDPSASEPMIAGDVVEDPGAFNPAGTLDEEIFAQFTEALTSQPATTSILGRVGTRYAYGVSQTAAVLLETQRNLARSQSQGLFDITLLHTAGWRGNAPGAVAFDLLDGEFEPLAGVGRVFFVQTEADQILSETEQFRRSVEDPSYRVYEVAGAAHVPTPRNPLNHNAVARALFVVADAWVRRGVEPPASRLVQAAPEGQIDPVYGIETGVARDGDLNALGGVRLPDLNVGRAQFIASDPETRDFPPPFAILTGSMVDLVCEPAPDSETDEPRFRSHGDYVSRFTRQVNELQRAGFLLEADAEAMKERAAESEVGKLGTCAE